MEINFVDYPTRLTGVIDEKMYSDAQKGERSLNFGNCVTQGF